MALEFSTAGMGLYYAVEAVAGTRPTTGYTEIPEVKSLPEFATEPNTLQTTPLNATKYHTYIEGLRDLGGAYGLTVNDCSTFRTAWTSLITASTTAAGSGKATWFEICYPTSSGMDSFYFTADPVSLGFGGAEVDSVIENTAYLVPNTMGEPTFASASTAKVNPNIVTVAKNGTTTVTLSNYTGTLTATTDDNTIATASVSGSVVSITGVAVGTTSVAIKVNGNTVATIPVTVTN